SPTTETEHVFCLSTVVTKDHSPSFNSLPPDFLPKIHKTELLFQKNGTAGIDKCTTRASTTLSCFREGSKHAQSQTAEKERRFKQDEETPSHARERGAGQACTETDRHGQTRTDLKI